MTIDQLLPIIGTNVIAAWLFFAWRDERKERIAVQDRLDRTLLAFSGFRTEPDTQNIVRLDNNPPAARAAGTYATEKP